MSSQGKWVIGIVSVIVIFALLACGIFFAWRYFFAGKPPSVEITSPPSNTEVREGETLRVEATASGGSLEGIELRVDDVLVNSATSPSPVDSFRAELAWQATGLGRHMVEVKARNSGGVESDPARIIIIVVPIVAEATPTIGLPMETPTETPTATPTPPPGATPTPTSPAPTATPTLAPPVIDSFTIDDSTITDGETTYLRWEFHNATESHLYRDDVEIDSGLPSSGNKPVNPHVTRTFKLVVSNAAGSAEKSVTLTVLPPATADFWADPENVTTGQTFTLYWHVEGATAIHLSGEGVGVNVPVAGPDGDRSLSLGSVGDRTYTLHVSAPGGDFDVYATVHVTAAPPSEVTVVIDLDAVKSGSVREDGSLLTYAQPGDSTGNQRVKGFLSWDIWSFVPDGAEVVSARVTWNTYCFHGGAIVDCAGPFAGFGPLRVRAYYYDMLDPSDFAMSGLTGGTLITSYTSQPTGSLDVTAAVLDVNRPWDPFQIYVLFQNATYFPNFYDGVRFEEGGGKNRLTVTYQP